jgi:hypothetical protein
MKPKNWLIGNGDEITDLMGQRTSAEVICGQYPRNIRNPFER